MTKHIDKDTFYRSLFMHNPEIALYLDSDGVIAKANQNLFKRTGYKEEEVSVSPLFKYLPKHEQGNYQKNFLEVLNGVPKSMDTFFIHNNGESIPIHIVLIPAIVEGKVTGAFGIIIDKSEALKLENSLLESEMKFRAIVEEALVGVYILKDNCLLYGNPYYHQLLGTKYGDVNIDIINFVHPEDINELQSTFDSLKEGEEGITHYCRVIRKNGSEIEIEAHSKLIFIDQDPIILGTIIDITERKESWDKINFLAYFDQLTELPNRKSFEETLEKELVIAKTLNQKLAIMYLDLDRFKYTNDTLGHHVGDELLKAISKRLLIVLGDEHQLFRISGDEFAIISPDCKTINTIIDKANQIISAMEEQFVIESYTLSMTTSIGISLFPTDGEDTISLMKNADAALHHAEQDGKNTFKVYSSTMDIRTYRAFKLGSDIRLALENDQLEYYFQPKVSTENNEMVGAEALIRWNHPEWGILSPNEFIPIIEEHGLIAEVGIKMNWKVAKQIKAWQEMGLPQIPISVNLSAKRFLDKNLVNNFQEILEDTKLDPEFIEIEIVETSMLENEKIVLNTLNDLIRTGITISLDDFGTGYSSLSYLTKFNKYIGTLKIDRSFITHLSQDEENESNLITKTMITLADSLRMSVIAEGVETYEQYQILKQMGCKVVQGYLFSKPLPASEFEELLKIGTIDIPNAPQLENPAIEEQRKFFRVPLHFPLSGSMTITRINGRMVDIGKTVVLIEDIGLGGLRFLTDLKLTVNLNIILEFETYLFGEPIKLLGSIVWMNEIKTDIYQYGLEYAFEESERAEFTPILNKLAIKLRQAPIVPDCSFVTEDRYNFIKKLRK
ncbi:PAS domain S-box-containing protein/diguanylate cyclase (GGDEF) domain-containing protein [Psychrobacillus sp. OK028]|uniref:EAL domain-containing protein n=1 Tax=Psychrobacillus sp. OK028 TaxID=1884359 RepID=UPI00088CA46D|nr:EAL domain-containing protein [Psychrobacillus sp. OK028]SDM90477.1 PAS domain S-box-containing protein/diguanylate cyclase (GGDEF) domain-containing protein [Psychrobacillus sp. OK028]